MDPGSENGASSVWDIGQALHKKAQAHGNSSGYDVVLKELTCPDISDVCLHRWLQELKGCTSHVGKGCEDLVGTILELDWIHKDDQFVHDYIDCLTSVVSGNAVFLSPCIQKMISLMKPKTLQDTDLKVVFDRAHQALCYILQLAPGGLHVVQKMVQELFPYRGKDAFILDCYVMNLLRLLDYAESLRPFILELIVTKLIQIDTELPKEGRDLVSDDEEASEEEDEQPQFQVEVNDDADISEFTPYSWPDPSGAANDLSSKVDVLMTRLLAYCNYCCHPRGYLLCSSVFSKHEASYLFRILLEIFRKCILPTYGSFHPQFLCFYVCSLHKTFYEGFLHQLCTTVESVSASATVRQSAAAYIGSFVARAKFIPLSCTKTALWILVQWIHRYIDQSDHLSSSADISIHGPFYAACQAVFYIFIFHHKQLMDAEFGLQYMQSLNLARVVSCSLNPLLVCLDSVVKMFATLTRNYQLAFCYTVIEHNRRMLVLHRHKASFAVQTFFPFDPYKLPKSVKFIRPLYQDWQGANPSDLISEDDSESELDTDDEYLQNHGISELDRDKMSGILLANGSTQ